MAAKKSRKQKSAETLYEKADALREEGQLEASIEVFEACLALVPGHISALNDMGIALHDLGDTEAAIEAYQKVLALDPEYIRTLNNLGNALQDAGHWDQALQSYEQALAQDPEYIDAIYNMAVAYQEQGEVADAAKAFAGVLALEPAHPTAGHMAAALSGETTAAAPVEYVRELFDDYARNFEDDLTGELKYQTPVILRKLLQKHLKLTPASLDILDLGCGTGLLGAELFKFAKILVGVDLSSGMLAEAAKKQIYDELIEKDITAYLRRARGQFDLITAADVLVYLGDLRPLFSAVNKRLAPGGLFLVSTEKSETGDYELGISGRFRHRKVYVQAMAADAGLLLQRVKKSELREDAGEPVDGHCFLFQSV